MNIVHGNEINNYQLVSSWSCPTDGGGDWNPPSQEAEDWNRLGIIFLLDVGNRKGKTIGGG